MSKFSVGQKVLADLGDWSEPRAGEFVAGTVIEVYCPQGNRESNYAIKLDSPLTNIYLPGCRSSIPGGILLFPENHGAWFGEKYIKEAEAVDGLLTEVITVKTYKVALNGFFTKKELEKNIQKLQELLND